MELMTWGDLGRKIDAMSPEQRSQPIQCVLPHPDDGHVQECLPGIALGTVAEFGFSASRSTHDNKYHGDDVVLLLDSNCFSEEGAIAHRLHNDLTRSPIYGVDGPTLPSQQRAPSDVASRSGDGNFSAHEIAAAWSRDTFSRRHEGLR